MIIDIIFAVLLVLALFRGYSQGLILGIFSFLSIIIGLAAALKLSAVVAGYIGEAVKVSEQWLPLISFIIVFIMVVLLVRLGARAIQKSIELVMLGWLNRLGGILFFVFIYTLVYSVLLFYGEEMKLISAETISQSKTWTYIRPIAPKVIDGIGTILPFFRNMFGQLQEFFGSIGK
jgi:membrane protein required for colicin V production